MTTDQRPDPAAAEVERLRAIITGPLGKAHPGLAEAIAFETALPPETALKLLEAADTDREGPVHG